MEAKNINQSLENPTQTGNESSNDAIYDAQTNTGNEILKITKMGGFTQVILATLEKIKDPARKVKELQEARANFCKINPTDCANDDIYKKIA